VEKRCSIDKGHYVLEFLVAPLGDHVERLMAHAILARQEAAADQKRICRREILEPDALGGPGLISCSGRAGPGGRPWQEDRIA
jgi:hypothetical protein